MSNAEEDVNGILLYLAANPNEGKVDETALAAIALSSSFHRFRTDSVSLLRSPLF